MNVNIEGLPTITHFNWTWNLNSNGGHYIIVQNKLTDF